MSAISPPESLLRIFHFHVAFLLFRHVPPCNKVVALKWSAHWRRVAASSVEQEEEEEEKGGTASLGGRFKKKREIVKRARLLSSDGKVFFLD